MTLFVAVAPARIAADEYFTGDTALDYVGRDLDALCAPSEWLMDAGNPANVGAWADWFDIYVCFPEAYGGDDSWPARLELSLSFTIEFSDAGTLWARIGSTGTTNILTKAGGAGTVARTITRQWTDPNIPTGVTKLTVQGYMQTGGVDATPSRALGAATSQTLAYYRIVEVTQ